MTRAGSGTQCSRPAFILLAGTVQILLLRSISPHVASVTSPPRAAVRIRNSSALAATATGPQALDKRRNLIVRHSRLMAALELLAARQEVVKVPPPLCWVFASAPSARLGGVQYLLDAPA
ncbi:MAG: hypothetical protein P4L94_28925 [Telmatospirillum sp.]|nr:hypothetical protein [Telmatospirillum sp.]MDR3440652.1 hypothetical protein [Telmatospirillum sp.]